MNITAEVIHLMTMESFGGSMVVLAAVLFFTIVSAAVLYLSISGKGGVSHRYISYMSVVLLVALLSYLVIACGEERLIMSWAYRAADGAAYAFLYLALLLAVEFSLKPKDLDPRILKGMHAVAGLLIVIVLINPLDLYMSEYLVAQHGYSYIAPAVGGIWPVLMLFALLCALFTIILPFKAFAEARGGGYYDNLTLISAGGFVLLLGGFYLNFEIMAGDPLLTSLVLYAVFLIIAYVSVLQLNVFIFEPDIKALALDKMYMAVIAIDENGCLAYANEAAETLFGFRFERVCGEQVDEYVPWSELKRIEEDPKGEILNIDKGGGLRTFKVNPFPLIGPQADLKGTAYLLRDISDISHYNESVSIALEKLELLNSVSRHDILNHLTIIHGYAEMASLVDDPEKRDGYINKILDSSIKAEGVINFNRAYKGMGMDLDWIPLGDMLNKAVGEAEVGGMLKLDIQTDGVEVFADALIQRAVYNIMHNALAHAEGASRLSVSMGWSEGGDEYRIVIEDDGIGVPSEEKDLIFRNGYGKISGFGLFLTSQILAISKARIWEEGERGARFVIAIPRSHVRAL